MKDIILIMLFCLFCLSIVGCYSNVKFTTPGGKLVGEYTRFGNQNIEGFYIIIDPNGKVRCGFEKQMSETEIAFQLGQLVGAKIGGVSK